MSELTFMELVVVASSILMAGFVHHGMGVFKSFVRSVAIEKPVYDKRGAANALLMGAISGTVGIIWALYSDDYEPIALTAHAYVHSVGVHLALITVVDKMLMGKFSPRKPKTAHEPMGAGNGY